VPSISLFRESSISAKKILFVNKKNIHMCKFQNLFFPEASISTAFTVAFSAAFSANFSASSAERKRKTFPLAEKAEHIHVP